MDILVYLDKSHSLLYDLFFLPSFEESNLSNNFNIKKYIKEEKTENNNFESPYWCSIIVERFDILINYIYKNMGKWAIFSDVDIIFFQNFYSDIENLIYNKNNKHIFYMPENNNSGGLLNGGFFVFRCCDEIVQWFNIIKNNIIMMDRPNDQTFINSCLRRKNTGDYKFIDRLDHRTFSCNNVNPSYTKSYIRNDLLKVFHATSTFNIFEKINVLSSAHILYKYHKNKINIIPNVWFGIQ